MYLRILYKIHVFGFMSQHLCISRILCKIHVNVSGFMSQHLYISGSSARSMSPDPCLRFMSQHPYVSQEPLQDPCLRIRILHPYVSQDPLQDPCLRFMSQHLYTSGSSARSMSSDSCLSIFESQAPLQDTCLRIRIEASICISGSSARSMSPDSCLSIQIYLRNLCNIHVSGPVYKHPYVSQAPLQDPCLRIRI